MKHICQLCKFEVRKVNTMGLCIDCKYHIARPCEENIEYNTVDKETSDFYKSTASLVELTCDVLIQNREQVVHMTNKLAEGDIHWICLLKAWYRSKNKKIPINVDSSLNPKHKILHLLDI